jgi:predicted alpha/beta superfamily hydrolase
MSHFLRSTIIAICIVLTSMLVQAQSKEDVLIDRFDKANSRTLTKGAWYTYTDKPDGGESTIKTLYEKDSSGNQFYGFNYQLQKGRLPWNPLAAVACHISGKKIPSGVQAIAYEFKGNEHLFIFRSDNIKDYAFHQKHIPASKEWTTVIIPIAALSQPDWGGKVTFSEADLNGFSWQVGGQSNDSGKVAIDNVRLLYTPQHVISKGTEDKISIGHTEIFHSKLLKEDRGLSIYLPAPISEMRSSKKTYPVIYLLDGDAHIKSLASMVQAISPAYGNTVLPEVIIIGINNTNRWRDLSPSHVTKSPFGHTPEMLAATGGGEKFMDFIEKELIPQVDSIYPTAPFRILIGHSLGGLTVINTLVHRPNLFNAYLAIDPSLWWNNQLLNKQAAASLDSLKLGNKQLFIATANNMYAGVDTNKLKSDTSKFALPMRSIFDFTSILEKHPGSHLRWKNVYYPDDDHNSVPLIAGYDGLRYFFDFNRITFKYQLDLPEFNVDSAFTKHYHIVSQKMGYTIKPPEDFINRLGYDYLNVAQTSKHALAFFQMNVRNYPNSVDAYYGLGEYYEKSGDKMNAIKNYKIALAIAERAYIRKKIEQLEASK